jgi:hypothetical protein
MYKAVTLSSHTTHTEALYVGPIKERIIFISMTVVKFKSISKGR